MSKINTYTVATSSFPAVFQTSPGSTASGSNILLNYVYIPANQFTVGDTVEVAFLVTDDSISTTGNTTLYWNSGTTSTSGAVNLGFNQTSASGYQFQPILRYLHIASPTVTYTAATSSILSTQISTLLSETSNTTTIVSVNIDWTVNSYIFIYSFVTGNRCQYLYIYKK